MDPDEEAQIQQMLLSMLTNRQPEPVQESSPLQQGRAAMAEAAMSDPFYGDAPLYYTPASSYDFTDENVHNVYMERMANDAERRAAGLPDDPFYREAWQQGVDEDDRHSDWALPKTTPPWVRVQQRAGR